MASSSVPPVQSTIEKRAPLLLGIAFVSLLGLLFVNFTFRKYQSTYLRQAPALNPCVIGYGIGLQTESAATTTELRNGPNGEKVALRPSEIGAISCVRHIDPRLSEGLRDAFAEREPSKRALAFVEVAKAAPPGVEGERWVEAAYLLGTGSLKSLEKTPATRAAADALELIQACRFHTATVCPTRPPEPIVMWIVGVPASIGVSVPFLLFAGEGVRRLLASRGKPKKKKKAARST